MVRFTSTVPRPYPGTMERFVRLATWGRTLLPAAAAALVALIGALAAPALATGTATQPAGTTTQPCAITQLRLKVVDRQAAAGRRYIDYAFENAGKVECSLLGYPAAVLLTQSGQAIHPAPATVAPWPLSQLHTVLIGPSGNAFFTFTWVVGAVCPGHAFTFSGLRVLPPRATTGFQWHLGRTAACGSTFVSAVRPELFPF
jgi:hypothetical protein